jgi:hypothetical protein
MLLSLFIHAASGYESDQLTARLHELDDARQLANATANEMLARAIARTNVMAADADGTCRSDTATLSHELARNIREVMGKTTLIPSRGEQGIMYYGTYAAWLETGPIDRYTFTERNDIYSQVSFAENPIIATWAPASTIRLGDVLLGVDKIDHFWVQGHLYYEKAHQGERDEQAVRYGTRTERMKWGMMTTGVFSYADLAANYDGYRFYRDLLQPGSILQRDEDGCVVQVEGFDWGSVVDWRYDEVYNPPVYRQSIQREVEQFLTLNREEICAGLAEQGDWPTATNLSESPEYVYRTAPPRVDPFQLESRCSDGLL